MDKFIVKPIRQKIKKKSANLKRKKNEGAEHKLENFYKNTKETTIQKPNNYSPLWVLVVLVSILCGLLGNLLYNLLFKQESPMADGQKIIIERQEKITVTNEERLHQLSQNINPVIINFYNNSKNVNGPFYQNNYSFGSGFVLTSDGWLVTSQGVMNKIKGKNYVILTADYKVYKVEKILKDTVSRAVFVKIKAKNLAVPKLGALDKLKSGQKVYAFIAAYPEPKIASLHLADLHASSLDDVVASTEQFSHFISSREGYDPSLIGSPIVNLAGEIVAIIDSPRNAIPLDYLLVAINDLNKKNKVERASLGVHYIDLAKYPRVDPKTGKMRNKGALLSNFKNLLAVEKGSVADTAGLMVGDIILNVEDEPINGRKNLTAIIQAYQHGQTLKLTVLRNGKEKTFKIKLNKL